MVTRGLETGVGSFQPAVRAWFERRFPEGPTEAQALGWPAVMRGEHTLIAAPTGSGKTLAGFLVAIDELYRRHAAGEDITGATQVVYVSPLKALAVDVHTNLEEPLRGIAAVATELGQEPAPIRLGVRSGDTSPSERQALVRNPPNFLITTPESLFLYLTAARSRATLSQVDTMIVDEIHALARDKRGSHLALSLERLTHVARGVPVRIGLSATQEPIESMGRLLVGTMPCRGRSSRDGRSATRPLTTVDIGHRRQLDLSIEVPGGELEAVMSGEQLGSLLDRIASHVEHHRTTLVFVNTRRWSERVAHLLAERLGDDVVAAHHGSLSKERRQRVEGRLRNGDLRALVATASLELGIDVGPVELVCQLGSPRNIATFLQRVGRANHHRSGVPRGILCPTTRDENVECLALLAAVRAGRLDRVRPPDKPLDVLAQQVVAEVAAASDDGWREEALYELVRGASPYEGLTPDEFDEILTLVSDGIETGRGRRMAYLRRDRVHGRLTARRGARLAALTSGGAIPDTADYRVLLEPGDVFVGTVNEDFAIESMQGDVFALGSHSWRVLRVENGVVRVADAAGQPPTIPFWLGEAPGRSDELSDEVSQFRALVISELVHGDRTTAAEAVVAHSGLSGPDSATAARSAVDYLDASRQALGGVLPTREHIVFERFFDESGGMQLVVHAPFGARINRALGLALRKKFCVRFDFELQAAASDDAVLLSLGPQHSFALRDVPGYVRAGTLEETLTQAVLTTPMFTARWRWNLNRSLAVLRQKGGRRNPFNIQRMEADDLMAAVFPGLAQCQDNAPAGPIEVPGHPLVRETLRDCLDEAMDAEGLRALLGRIEGGSVSAHFVDSTEPSPLAHEILNGAPYTFLDDAPLEERRSRAVPLRRGLPVDVGELGSLEPDAIERVRREVTPVVRDADELHDVLTSLVVCRPRDVWRELFEALVAAGRAFRLPALDAWVATERRRHVEAVFPGVVREPDHPLPVALAGETVTADAAAVDVVRGHLEIAGPVTEEELTETTALPATRVRSALAILEEEGSAFVGEFDPGIDGWQWCARRLLLRIHAYTRDRRRGEIRPVSEREWLAFLSDWWGETPGRQRHGRDGLLEVVEQLQGFEWAAGDWEAVFRRRVEHYRPEWLDDLCLSGTVVWGRLSLSDPAPVGGPVSGEPRRSGRTPSRRTPVTFALREDLPWLLQAHRGARCPSEPTAGSARDVLDALHAGGALFHADLQTMTSRLPTEVEEGLWDGVSRGLVTADGFNAVRSLLAAREQGRVRSRRPARVGSRGRRGGWRAGVEGRWTLMPGATSIEDVDELAEQVAGQLLLRWGVVFYEVFEKERLALAWRDIVGALRRFEARGLVRGGRFVLGASGEQYALPEVVEALEGARTT